MKYFYLSILLFFYGNANSWNSASILPPDATISGTTIVCQNSASPTVVFTGSSGVAPYTFTYKINNGPDLIITSSGTNSAVTLAAPTGVLGVFTYSLVSVQDSDTPAVTQNVTGTAVITVRSLPNANMDGTGSGTTFDNLAVFRVCSNSPSLFNFSNISNTITANTSYEIDWGDGSPGFMGANWTALSHTYQVGLWYLNYTVTRSNGCSITKTYIVFVGSNPAVSLGNPGNTDICSNNSLTFPITGTENNSVGTNYIVTFNDGSAPVSFNHPPPATVTHTFLISSCGTNSNSGGTNFPNSFFASIRAVNPCDQSSASIVPIRISSPPVPSFSLPQPNFCTQTPVCVTNTTIGGDSAVSSGCLPPKLIWTITPSLGVTLSSGIYGSDFGSTNTNNWITGSQVICPEFSIPGTYTITMKTGNKCGIATATRTICVETPLTPLFSIDTLTGCAPVAVNATNNTVVATQCTPVPDYLWTVTYASDFCDSTVVLIPDQTTENATFNFVQSGIYTISLSVTNSCGTTTTSETVRVKSAPVVSIASIPNACDTADFTPTATVNNCAPATSSTSYLWGFPGGTPATATSLIPGTINYPAIGNYTISLNATNECGVSVTDTESFSIGITPTITNSNSTESICSGASTVPLNFTATPSIATFSWTATATAGISGFLSSGTSNSIPAQNIITSDPNSGTVTYVITPILNGCFGLPINYVITVHPNPIITVQPLSNTLCLGEVASLLALDTNTLSSLAAYQWFSNSVDSNSGGNLINGATAAIYDPPVSVVGTVYYYCVVSFPSLASVCNAIVSDTAAITVNDTPSITGMTSTICSATSFLISPSNSGGNNVPVGTTYTWSTPIINPVGSVIGATDEIVPQTEISQTLVNNTNFPATVTYTVTPQSGTCVGANFSVTITINPTINPNTIVNNNLCFGQSSASIITNIVGGIPPYDITWSGPNGFSSTAASIANLQTGDYVLTINASSSCPFTETYTVDVPDILQITTDNANDITCFGAANGTIAITAIGGSGIYNYTWTKDALPFSNSEDLSNLSPGNYNLSVTDSNNCGPISASFVITQPPVLDANFVSQTNVLCFGAATGQININPNGGTPIEVVPGVFDYSYSWAGPNGFTSTGQNGTNLFAGNYTLIMTDSLGCTDSVVVTILQSTEIVITATTTAISCFGANNASFTTTISGGNGPYQFQWSNLSTTLNQNNLSAGTYTITVTDTLGCVKIESIVIPEAPVFTVNPIVNNITCFGLNNGSINLNLTGGTAPVSLSWNDGSTAGVSRNNLGPGTYIATITDGNACSITRTFTLLEPLSLVASATVINPLNCSGAITGGIDLTVSGGTFPFTYAWSNGATTEDLNNVNAGTYQVVVTDTNGCTITNQFDVVRPTPIVINVATETNFDCTTRQVTQQFVAQASGGVLPLQYQWSTGTISGPNNTIMSSTANGVVVLTVTDSIGCSATYTVNVNNPVIGNSAFATTSFGYTSYGIYSIVDPIEFQSTITGDYISVSWDFGDGTFSSEISPTHSYLIPKSYTVKQTVIYPFGCIYVQTIQLDVEKGYVLVLPTAFTPNDDGINDTFRPVAKRVKKITMDIYDTWGSIIYSESGDVIVGWDGKIKGLNAENGNYYAKVTTETFYGTTVFENQTIVLLK